MKSKSKARPSSVPEVILKPKAKAPALKPSSVPKEIPKPKAKAPGLKGSVNRAVAWAKKNPAMAALLIGGVVLLAIVLMRKGTGIGATRADSRDSGDAEDIMGGLGGTGLESYKPSPLSDFIIPEFFLPEIPLYTEPEYTYWYPQEEVAQSSTFYPEDEVDREYYLERAHELEALAGETEDPYFRGLIADMARLTGLGSLSEEDWEAWERQQREATERQRGRETTTTRRSTTQTAAQSTIRAISPLQYLINQFKRVLTPRVTTPSTISERRHTLPSTYARPSTQPSSPTIGPSITPTFDTSTYAGQMDLYQSIVSGGRTEPIITTRDSRIGGLQEN